MKHIFLIGFMGCGKSTIAKSLARELSVSQQEMDERIVIEQKMPITELFERFGEGHFRDIETALLRQICREEGAIVSCGGGVVLREENVAMMKQAGTIVLLTATPETILERVKNNKDRPILNGNMNISYITELMEKRSACYAKAADLAIATDGKSVEDITGEILRSVGEEQ